MFLAMAKDILSYPDWLADRLAQYAYIKHMTPATEGKGQRDHGYLCTDRPETCGISKIKIELDDLSLRYLEPEVYYDLARQINLKRSSVRLCRYIVEAVFMSYMAQSYQGAQVNGRGSYL